MATDAAPKTKPNQDLIKGALGEVIDKLFILEFYIRTYALTDSKKY